MMRPDRSGFAILEVLPAMLVLMGALLIASRMLALAVETRMRPRQVMAAENIMETVWQELQLLGGSAAVVSRGPDNHPVISTFPDESWLPADADVTSTILFRRRRTLSPPGWELDRLSNGDWRPLTTILSFPAGENRE